MSDYPAGSTAKKYQDSEGNEVTLLQLIKAEPEWAASRIKAGEKSEARIKEDGYLETIEAGLQVLCNATGINTEFYDRDQADIACYMDCFNDMAAALNKFGITFDDESGEFVQVKWNDTPPDEECRWWWWNGDEDAEPIPVSILYSGTKGQYFASIGQHGWMVSQWVKDMGGMWAKLTVPASPIT